MSAARLEVEVLNPNGFVQDALQQQAYRQTYWAMRHAKTAEQKPTGWLADLVEDNDFEIEDEEYAKRAG